MSTFPEPTPDDLRAKTLTASQFMDEVIAGTMNRHGYFWLPLDEQNKVAEFAKLLEELIYGQVEAD